jgi:uncharacterized repeat protein (TIGR03803 family)
MKAPARATLTGNEETSVKRATFISSYIVIAQLFILGSALPAFGATEKVLHAFSAFPHGDYPSGLVADAAGNFYGAAQGGSYNQGIVYRLVADSEGKVTQTVLYNFTGGLDGGNPLGIVPDNAGNLYGFANLGGSQNAGVFFKLTPSVRSAWTESVLYNFTDTGDGDFNGPPVYAGAGKFYGQTYGWGPSYGFIFGLTQSSGGTWVENVIYTFTGGGDGGAPFGPLAIDASGNLYGTGAVGGTHNMGVAFELSPSQGTWTERVIYNFAGGADGYSAEGGLIFDKAGNLYGTTVGGGNAAGCTAAVGCGTVFELKPATGGGWSESVLFSFGNPSGLPLAVYPSAVVMDGDGNLYGTTYYGGASGVCVYGCGSLYQLSPNSNGSWTETVINNFDPEPGGYNPSGGAILGLGGRLYGTTTLGGLAGDLNGTVFEATPNPNGAWKVTTPFAFPTTDSNDSQSTLIEDAEGNLYGTTVGGGLDNIGTVFKLSSASGKWRAQILFEFVGTTYGAAAGSFPESGLVMDSPGNLFGTAFGGGASNLGAVFKLTLTASGSWDETVLHSFGSGSDGANPAAALIFDSAGNLYGTTEYGGLYSDGMVFKLSPGANGTWTESVLYSFAGYPADGADPTASLVFDSKGNLYGTTLIGGSSPNCKNNKKSIGCGTVFELSPGVQGRWSETPLYSFTNVNGDGAYPYANLVLDGAGNLYGTTENGGVSGKCEGLGTSNCGTVFEMMPDAGGWSEKIVYEFKGYNSDGAYPMAGLVMDSRGNLYGTTELGGNASNAQYDLGFGTVFELSPSGGGEWTESVLHNFQLGADGGFPQAGVLLDSSGNLFGATAGNAYTGSVVYEVTP